MTSPRRCFLKSPSALAGGHLATGLVLEMTGRLAEASDKFERVIQISRASGVLRKDAGSMPLIRHIPAPDDRP